MQVFRYDKTFEGLLTALFDAYEQRVFPDRLIGEKEAAPLFAEVVHTVVADAGKAERVWKGVEEKLSRNVARMLMCVWLSETPGCDGLLFRYLRKAFDAPRSIATDFGDDDVLEAVKLARKVDKEKHYLVQFVRFQQAADGTYFAPVSPLYNALPLAVPHFRDRFSDQKWLIYDFKRRYGYYYDGQEVREVTFEDDALLRDKLEDRQMAEDEKCYQELWKGYFRAAAVRERLNPRLHRQHMPRRFWKYLTEKW